MKKVNRYEVLAAQFNNFMNRVGATDGADYYARLSTRDFVELKNVLSNINNIITLRMTHAFAEWLHLHGVVDKAQFAAICAGIEGTNANANGYDVQFAGRVGCADGIVAEVKCNIPVKPDRFGAAQLSNLNKDIEGLLRGKTKARGVNPENYLKFLVLLDDGERVRPAVEHFAASLLKQGHRIVTTDKLKNSELNTNTIYIAILTL